MLYILKSAWAKHKFFAAKGQPGIYPQMRDPNLLPKCYEMTETEKLHAMKTVVQNYPF